MKTCHHIPSTIKVAKNRHKSAKNYIKIREKYLNATHLGTFKPAKLDLDEGYLLKVTYESCFSNYQLFDQSRGPRVFYRATVCSLFLGIWHWGQYDV